LHMLLIYLLRKSIVAIAEAESVLSVVFFPVDVALRVFTPCDEIIRDLVCAHSM